MPSYPTLDAEGPSLVNLALKGHIVKVGITGASHFVNRLFEACGPYQWAREFLRNSLEAGATQIEFGIEWQAVDKLGKYRRTVIDNGSGMSRDELLTFFSTLGEGKKKIGGVHDNFGVGAKIASLPWNPEGVVVVSYKDGKASMIWIVLEPESSDYELIEFNVGDGRSSVIDPASRCAVSSSVAKRRISGPHLRMKRRILAAPTIGGFWVLATTSPA